MSLLDTNVFLRFLTRDDMVKADACRSLFSRLASGDEESFTTESVVAEVVYVLSSQSLYGLERDAIRARLRPLLTARGLKLLEKGVMLRALDLYVDHTFLDFEDALSIAWLQRRQDNRIISYDADFDRVPGISRCEP